MALEDLQQILPERIKVSGRSLHIVVASVILVLLLTCVILVILVGVQVGHGLPGSGRGTLAAQDSLPAYAGKCVSAQCLRVAARLAEDLDTSANPCENFYKFSCGGWEKRNSILAYHSEVTVFGKVLDRSMERMREVVGSPIRRNSPSSAERKLKQFYKMCLNDYGRMQERGKVLIQTIKTKLTGWYVLDPAGWKNHGWDTQDAITTVMGDFNVPVMIQTLLGRLWRSSRYVIILQSGGLGLRREAYSDPESLKIQEAYKEYMRASISQLLGDGNVTLDASSKRQRVSQCAEDAYGLEKNLSQIYLQATEEQDFWSYKLITLGEMERNFTQISWREVLGGVYPGHSLSDDTELWVRHLPYLRRLNGFLFNGMGTADKDRIINNYLVWRLIDTTANHLSWHYTQARQVYREKSYGITEVSPTWQRCLYTIRVNMAYALAAEHVRRHVGAERTSQVSEMFETIQSSLSERMGFVSWMDNRTQAIAKEKVMNVDKQIALPEEYFDDTFVDNMYSQLDINETDGYFTNYGRLVRFQQFIRGRSLEEGVADVWNFFPTFASFGTSPYYDSHSDMFLVPGGAMQDPLYFTDGPSVFNYGSLGSLIAEGLTMAINERGSWIWPNGTNGNWWSNETNVKYATQRQCFEDYFNGTTLGPYLIEGQNISLPIRASTQAWRIADEIAGLKSAYYAYHSKPSDPEQVPMGLNMTEDQIFFLAAAQTRCFLRTDQGSYTAASAQRIPEDMMLNAAVSHMEEFAGAFGCPASSTMGRRDRCMVF